MSPHAPKESVSRTAQAGTEAKQRYYLAYGCERDPFSDQGSRGLFYSGGERKKVVDELLHFARFTRSPLLLLGRAGVGKSAVLGQLQAQAEKDMEVGRVQVEIMQGERQLLEAILLAFHQPVREGDALFEQFCRWVSEQSQRQRYVLLCLDEAHNLSPEFLQAFYELINLPDSLFRLVLAGEQEIQPVLESLASRHELTLNAIELQPLGEQQVREYAQYRLRAAGYSGDLPFTDIQVRAAQRRSNGNIDQLNTVLREMLIAGGDNRRHFQFSYPAVNLLLASGISLLIILFALRDEPVAVDVEPELPALALERTQPVVSTPVTGKASQTTVEPVTESGEGAGPGQQPTASTQPGSEREVPEVDSPEIAEQPASVVLATAEPAPEPETVLADKREPPAPAPASDDSAGEQPDSSHGEQQAVSERLKNWPETGYALQIFGTHNAQRARKLVEEYFGQADLLFYETLHNGKPWFVVINGPYSGRQSAQQSISQLPDSLQRLRPWPRNIASIKGDIERYQAILGR